MATYDPLRDSRDTLMTAAIATLTDAGYTWNPKTTAFSEYLATALTGIGGSTVSNKTMSITQLLAGLVNELDAGPVSHLTSSFDQLLALLGGASNSNPTIQLSASSLTENSAEGTAVGNLSVSNGSGTYTFSLTDTAGSRFKVAGVNGVNLQAGATASNYEAATSYNITVQADNGVDTPISRVFAITIVNVLEITLNALTLDADEITSGDVEDTVVGALQSLTSGSTRSITDTAGGRFKLSGSNVVAGATPTDFDTATSHNITVRETIADATNSPRDSVIAITVLDVVVAPAAPALTWNSLETDDEPDFLVDLPSGNVDPDEDAAAGDHLIIEYQLQAGGAWTEYLDYTLLSGDITDDTISVTGVGAVANGDYFFRGRLERGALIGTNSANASVAINVAGGTDAIELEGTADLIELEGTTDNIELEAA